jgi:hypothetical protein
MSIPLLISGSSVVTRRKTRHYKGSADDVDAGAEF